MTTTVKKYDHGDFMKWYKELKPPKIDDKGLILVLQERWGALYQKCYNGEINSREYSIRRRAYENMIWELGGVLDAFLDDYLKWTEKKKNPKTKKNLFNLLFSLGFMRHIKYDASRNPYFTFKFQNELLIFPQKKKLQEHHWMTTKELLDANGLMTAEEFDKKFEIE